MSLSRPPVPLALEISPTPNVQHAVFLLEKQRVRSGRLLNAASFPGLRPLVLSGPLGRTARHNSPARRPRWRAGQPAARAAALCALSAIPVRAPRGPALSISLRSSLPLLSLSFLPSSPPGLRTLPPALRAVACNNTNGDPRARDPRLGRLLTLGRAWARPTLSMRGYRRAFAYFSIIRSRTMHGPSRAAGCPARQRGRRAQGTRSQAWPPAHARSRLGATHPVGARLGRASATSRYRFGVRRDRFHGALGRTLEASPAQPAISPRPCAPGAHSAGAERASPPG